MACELLQDAAAQLGAAASGGAPTTTLRFAHAETIVPLLGILGIGTDSFQFVPEAGTVILDPRMG